MKLFLNSPLNDVSGALENLDRAAEIYRKLKQTDQVKKIELAKENLRNRGLDVRDRSEVMSENEPDSSKRLNQAISLLQQDRIEEALDAFENALAHFRRLQDERREMIIILNFVRFILEREEVERALQLAQRAADLAELGQTEHRFLASLYLGEVWAEGMQNNIKAMEAYETALRVLRTLFDESPEEAQVLVSRLEYELAIVGQTALETGRFEVAEQVLHLLAPERAEESRGLKEPGVFEEPPEAETLRAMSYSALNPVLSAWRAAAEADVQPAAGPPAPVYERMSKWAVDMNWKEPQSRIARMCPVPTTQPASQGGPAGLLHLAKLRAKHLICFDSAVEIGRVLGIADDDLPCLCLFALQDPDLDKSVVGALLDLCGKIASDAVISAQCYRVFGVLVYSDRDPALALKIYLNADRRLEGVAAASALRADVQNDMAMTLIALDKPEEAIEKAESAQELARQAGDQTVLLLAGINKATALMNLERCSEALPVFEDVLKHPEAVPRHIIASLQYNVAVCRAQLGLPGVEIDEHATDPEQISFYADQLSSRGEHARAIKLFERGLSFMRSEGDYGAAAYRTNFANALWAAGRRREAIEQMSLAARLSEEVGNKEVLHIATSMLVTWALEERSASAEGFAEWAVAVARRLNNTEELALALASLGQARFLAGRHAKAVEALSEAHRLSERPEITAALADGLVSAGSASEAVPLFEHLLSSKGGVEDTEQIHLLLGLAQALESLQDREGALRLLREAHAYAARLPANDVTVEAFNRLGVALLSANRLVESADILEAGIDRARGAGLDRSLPQLLINLANTLKEMGNLDGAERTLVSVREECRKAGNPQPEVRALYGLGSVALMRHQFEQALAHFQEALAIAPQAGDTATEAAALDSAGAMYSALQKPQRAVEYHERASELHERLKDWANQAIDLQNLASAYLELREPKNAESVLHRALKANELAGIIEPDWHIRFIEAQVMAERGQWKKAKAGFRKAISDLEAIRHSLQTPGQQREWAALQTTYYSRATQAAIAAGDAVAAVQFIECNKTRFLQSMQVRRRRRSAEVAEDIWIRYERAADRRSQLQGRRRAALAFGDHELDRLAREAQNEYNRASAALQQAMEGVPEHSTKFTFPTITSLARCIPLGYAAVSVSVFPRGLGIACIGRKKTGELWSAVTQSEHFTGSDLNRIIFGDWAVLQSALADGTLNRVPTEAIGWVLGSRVGDLIQPWMTKIARVCDELGSRIWPEILKVIPRGTRDLILMPSAGLNVLPLHAAKLLDGSRVDEKFTITYAPSLGVLNKIRDYGPFPRAGTMAQVINPTEDQSLPFSNLEAQLAAALFGRKRVEAIPGKEASVDRTLAMLQRHAVFYFCGHAFFDLQEPFRSGLFCFPTSQGEVLTMATVLNKMGSISSRFVLLSACETGLVEPDDLLNDFLGLPGVFIVAGANAVLATLWRVDDLASCLLLEKFFELWHANPDATPEALAAAQLWLRTRVTVDYVIEKLEAWLEDPADIKQEEMLAVQHRDWLMRKDRNERPFEDEIYWAAFYITGLLNSPKRWG